MDFDLKTLASRVGGRLDGPAGLRICGVAGIRDAEAGECTFLAKRTYLPDLENTRASAVILPEGIECALPAIRCEDPHLGFVKAVDLFALPREELFAPGVHPAAHVDPSAELGVGVRVGPCAVISAGCRVGDGCMIGAGSVLMIDVTVGRDCLIYPNVTVRESCRLGDRVILHPGAVIGSDGFGFARDGESYAKIPQIGRVVLEDDVEIGANCCVDRATTGVTVIASGTKLDNLVQIGHNVRVGNRTVISAQTGISGSCSVGDDVVIGGQVGVADHLEIGDRARLGAKSGVSKSVPPESAVAGYPAKEHRRWRRLNAHVNRLPRYAEEIDALRKRLEVLERAKGASPAENT